MKRMSESARHRWSVLSRVVAASIGGYAFTWAAIVFVALVWPLPRAEAVGVATMLGFVIYAAVAMWVFVTRSAVRAWVGIAGWTAIFVLLNGWLMGGGAA